MTVNPSMSRESRFPPLPLGADGADPHIVGPCSQMGWARVLHAAVWVEAAREVGPGQEGSVGGATLLNHLYVESYPLALLSHDLGDALNQPAVRRGREEGSQVVLRPEPGSITRHQLLVSSVDCIIIAGAMQRTDTRVRELALPLVPGEGGLDHLAAEALRVAHVSHVIAEL